MNSALLLAIAGICLTSAGYSYGASNLEFGGISKKDVRKAGAVGKKGAEALMAQDSDSSEEDTDNFLAESKNLGPPDGLSGNSFGTGGAETTRYQGSFAELNPKRGYQSIMGAETRRSQGSKKSASDTWLKETKKMNKEKRRMEKISKKYSKS